MKLKKDFVIFLISYLILEIILTLISSINEIFLVLSIIVYFILLIKSKNQYELYYSSIIFVLSHYLIFTLSYAEILPWETGLVIVLVLIIIYYNIKFILLKNKSDFNCFRFEKLEEEIDSNINIIRIKCELSNILLYIYTLHLCLTTICTPSMYFDWFLIIKNCQFTYSNLHSSYTLSGGMIVSLTWAIISIYYFIKNRVR